MATLTVKPSNTLKIKTQRVKKAYLAKKEIKGTEKTGETESYTFKGSNNTSTKARKEKIATIIYKNIKGGLQKKQQQTTVAHIVEVLKKDSYTKGDCIDIPLILPKIEFTKLANANLGDEVYMVVETENMANKRIKLSLKQAEKNCLVEKDSSIVLQQDGKKTSVVETYVSRFAEQNKKNISNAEDFRNFAIDAVTLSPKEEKDQKKYREALNKTTDKKTKLFMVVDAESANQNWFEVKYEEFFDNRPNFWYYGDDNWFELGNIRKWHEPVDNPISTNYTQSGTQVTKYSKHWGLFGNTRNGSAHAGLDLFAKTGENIYACVDGTVYNRRWHGGYGNTITIKVDDPEGLLRLKRDYKIKKYSKEGEIEKGMGFSERGSIYLFYAHLDSVKEFSFGEKVKMGDVLGTTGRSGVKRGTRAPHLHFEVFSDYIMAKTKYRINPAYFVNYKDYDQQSEGDKKKQEDENKRGKIKEINGKKKLEYKNMLNFKK